MVTKYEWIDTRGLVWDLVNGPVALRAGVEGLAGASTLSFTQDFAFLDGQGFNGWRGLPREVLLPVTIQNQAGYAGGFAGVRNNWHAGLAPGKYGTFKVTSDFLGARTLQMRCVGDVATSLEIDPTVMGYEMAGYRFIADSPWWDGPDVSKTMQTPGDTLPFFAETSDRVFNIGSANTTGGATFYNPGEIDSWLTIRIDGPATGFAFGYGSTVSVAAEIVVNAGEYLIVDTNPTKQTATLFHSGYSEDVTDQLTAYSPIALESLSGYTFDNIILNGAGSMTISLTPHYQRAL